MQKYTLKKIRLSERIKNNNCFLLLLIIINKMLMILHLVKLMKPVKDLCTLKRLLTCVPHERRAGQPSRIRRYKSKKPVSLQLSIHEFDAQFQITRHQKPNETSFLLKWIIIEHSEHVQFDPTPIFFSPWHYKARHTVLLLVLHLPAGRRLQHTSYGLTSAMF